MNRLTQAIREKRRIVADYAPVRKGTEGERTLEPHALGVTKGKRLLRAWVREGASYSNGGLRVNDRNETDYRKRWRLFRVNQLSNVRLLPETFTVRNKYNAAGDKALTRVVAHVTPLPRTRSQVVSHYNTRSRKSR